MHGICLSFKVHKLDLIKLIMVVLDTQGRWMNFVCLLKSVANLKIMIFWHIKMHPHEKLNRSDGSTGLAAG